MTKQAKILIVEDTSGTLEALESAVKRVVPKHFSGMTYDVARCYNDASSLIEQNIYGIVLLDHRMPYDDVGDLEHSNFDGFCDRLENIGYSLIPQIKRKQPTTVVIGTSSLPKSDLPRQYQPDYTMSKMWGDAETDLDKILSEIPKV